MNFKGIIWMILSLSLIVSIGIVSATNVNDTSDDIVTQSSEIDLINEENNLEISQDNNINGLNVLQVSQNSLQNYGNVNDSDNLQVCPETGAVNGNPYDFYFNSTTGYTIVNTDLTFTGNFNAKTFGNFKINESITIDATDAIFNNVGFDLLASNITLIGGEFYADASVDTHAVINVTGDSASVTDIVIDVYAPEDQDFIAIDILNSNGTLIYNNHIYYECAYPNLDNTNYVIRVKNSPNITISFNEITSVLPFKNVDYHMSITGHMLRSISCIFIDESDGFVLYFNFIEGYIENTCIGFPTLDMVIICDSDNGYIGWNSIDEIDYVTEPDNPSYLYAIDLYMCNNLTIEFNEIYLESDGGTYIPGTIYGMGVAYGIQLTGGYSGVVIDYNTITTKNNGPNEGIYSQNFVGYTSLNITNNIISVEGNASFHEWSLVTGMELEVDYAYIGGNTITVNNKGGYVNGSNAYGISFSQYYLRLPSFDIFNNTIELVNGDFAVYIQDDVYANVNGNCLISTNYCGDDAVYDNENIIIENNYCPYCGGY